VDDASSSSSSSPPISFWMQPVVVLTVNGVLNYVASLSSYLLLSLTTNLTWQIANAMKRLVSIVASVL
jgi:hypothetical protein